MVLSHRTARPIHTKKIKITFFIYAVADNYFSFNGIDPNRLRFQLATMLVFVGIVGIGRPYIDRWLMKSNHK